MNPRRLLMELQLLAVTHLIGVLTFYGRLRSYFAPEPL